PGERVAGPATSCPWDRHLARSVRVRLASGWRNADYADGLSCFGVRKRLPVEWVPGMLLTACTPDSARLRGLRGLGGPSLCYPCREADVSWWPLKRSATTHRAHNNLLPSHPDPISNPAPRP